MDIDEIANGRRYRSPERRGERYDRGIGYSERSVRDALRAGVDRGWVVWRSTESGGHEYALHLKDMEVTADGRWVASTPAVSVETEAETEETPPVEAENVQEVVQPVVQAGPDTQMEFEIVQLRAQVAALTHLVQSLIGLLREVGIEGGAITDATAPLVDANAVGCLDVSAAPVDVSTVGCMDVNAAPADVSTATEDVSAVPDGRKCIAYYTDTIKTHSPTPPPDTAAHATNGQNGRGNGRQASGPGGVGGGDDSLSEELLAQLMALDPPMSPEAAARTIEEHGAETVQAWLLVLENDPTVRSVAALLTHKLRNGETPPSLGGRKAPQSGCPWCGGTGEVVLAHVSQTDPDYGKTIPCPSCG
jgi:hypothetical protein